LHGVRIFSNEWVENNSLEKADLSNIPSGMYFLKIFTERGSIKEKIVKK